MFWVHQIVTQNTNLRYLAIICVDAGVPHQFIMFGGFPDSVSKTEVKVNGGTFGEIPVLNWTLFSCGCCFELPTAPHLLHLFASWQLVGMRRLMRIRRLPAKRRMWLAHPRLPELSWSWIFCDDPVQYKKLIIWAEDLWGFPCNIAIKSPPNRSLGRWY